MKNKIYKINFFILQIFILLHLTACPLDSSENRYLLHLVKHQFQLWNSKVSIEYLKLFENQKYPENTLSQAIQNLN